MSPSVGHAFHVSLGVGATVAVSVSEGSGSARRCGIVADRKARAKSRPAKTPQLRSQYTVAASRTALRSCGFALQLLVQTAHDMHGSQLRWVQHLRHGESAKGTQPPHQLHTVDFPGVGVWPASSFCGSFVLKPRATRLKSLSDSSGQSVRRLRPETTDASFDSSLRRINRARDAAISHPESLSYSQSTHAALFLSAACCQGLLLWLWQFSFGPRHQKDLLTSQVELTGLMLDFESFDILQILESDETLTYSMSICYTVLMWL